MEATPSSRKVPVWEQLGASLLWGYRDARALYSLFVRTLYYCVKGRRDRRAIVYQAYQIGNKSLFFLTVTMSFIGMILVFQSGTQAKRVVPDMGLLGATFLKFLVRDLAASIGAMPLATRVGAGIAAEIGSMVVTEQVDALRMCSADPVDYLVVPRFIGSVIMSTVVLIWGGAAAYLAGMFGAHMFFGVSPYTFWNLGMVTGGDLCLGLIKCVTYGGAIAIISSHCGLRTFGGSEGVGWATTSAVVNSSFGIIVLNFIISVFGFFIFPG